MQSPSYSKAWEVKHWSSLYLLHSSEMIMLAFLGRWAADVVMLVVSVIWALNNIIAKMALTGWNSPGAFNALRFSLGALILGVVTLAVEGSLRIPRELFWKVALLGLLGNGVNQMLFINGLAHGTASNASVWLAIVPVLVAIMSGWLGLDRITPRLWVGALVSFSGIVIALMTNGTGFQIGTGDLFFAGAVIAWAGFTVFSKPLVQNVSALRVTAVAMLIASLGLLLLNGPDILQQDLSLVPTNSWLGLAYAGIMSNAAGYSMYTWAVGRSGPARAALYNNLGPILTGAAAWYWLDEVWKPLQWLGVALVIGGVITARWEDLMRALSDRSTPVVGKHSA